MRGRYFKVRERLRKRTLYACVLTLCCSVVLQAEMRGRQVAQPYAVQAGVVSEDTGVPSTLAGALQAIFDAADVVFAGQVIAVERGEDFVTVRFAVEDGVRGVS